MEAEALLDKIRSYGLDGAIARQERQKLDRARASSEAPSSDQITEYLVAKGSINILVVGGNETQKRYDAAISRELGERYPRLKVNFMHTGWDSNWGVQIEDVERALPRTAAVVVLRFVRTQLGRGVRRACGTAGVPWFPCTGHGKDFITGAIERAVRQLATWRA